MKKTALFILCLCIILFIIHSLAWGFLLSPAKGLWLSGAWANLNIDIYLQINHKIQKSCEKILKKNKGTILVMDVKSSKILAVTNPETAFKKTHPPGSIFKIISAYTMLEEGINPNSYITCKNFYKDENYSFSCSLPGGHGKVNLTRALSHSCAVYFYKNSKFINPEKLINFAKKFGIKNAKLPEDKKEYLELLIGEGRCIQTTPLEVALMMRHVVLEDTGNKKNYFRLIKGSLLEAVELGTAKKAKVEELDIAGKTGTATNLRNASKFHGWFAGFAPIRYPEIIVVVFLMEGHGYLETSEIAGRVFKEYFQNKNPTIN